MEKNSHRPEIIRFRAFKSAAITLALSVSCTAPLQFNNPVFATATVSGATKIDVKANPSDGNVAVNKAPSKNTDTKSKRSGKKSATGLDATTLKLINEGQWKAAVVRLESKQREANTRSTSKSKTEKFGIRKGWLAFAYLFDNQCDKLDALTSDLKVDSSLDDEPYALCAVAFSQTCHGHPDDAFKTLQRMPSRVNDDAFCNFALAAISGKQGKAEVAITYLQRSCELAPDFAWGFRTIAFLYERWFKDLPKAEASYLKALSIEPNQTEARDAVCNIRTARGDYDGAIELAQAAFKLHPKSAANYARLSQIYIAQKRFKEAQNELNAAIKMSPADAKYFRARASVKRFRNDFNGAILDQEKAVELSQNKAFELAELASLNALAGNKNRAADDLQRALEIDSTNQAAHDRLLVFLDEEGRYDDIVKEYQRAVEKQPKDEALHLKLGTALLKVGKIDEAKKQFVQAQNLNISDPEPRRLMGQVYLRDRNYEKAAKEFSQALNISLNVSTSSFNSVADLVSLGYCYWQNGDYMQAEAAYVTSLAMQQIMVQNSGPDRLDVMRSLALLMLDEKRYADAASQCESVIAMDKDPVQRVSDEYMLAQSRALRDLSSTSVTKMLEAYDKLTEMQKRDQLFNVIDALLKANKPDLAAKFLQDKQNLSLVDSFDDQHKAVFYIQESNLYRLNHNNVSQNSSGLKDLEQAIAAAEKVSSLKDVPAAQKSDAFLAIAQAYVDQSDFDKAAGAIQSANDVYSKNVAAYVLAASLSLKKGDTEMAIVQAKRALVLNPYDAKAYLVLGQAQEKAGQPKDATASFRKAVEMYPAFLEAHKVLLENLKKLSLTEDAQKEAQQIAQLEKQQ